MNGFEMNETGPLECSPDMPWGLQAVMENVCPPCGWIARGTAGEAEKLPNG